MSILRMVPLTPTAPPTLSLSSISGLTNGVTQLPLHHTTTTPIRRPTTTIRMGGGPRTFPGGVSKWQWKRMQAKKQKQLLKARLSRERQIYEMRKRAELRAAVSELERPWEVVERAPTLFSVAADDQLKALADRFHRPGGYDMWSERDGPQLFHTPDGLPSARFLPKNSVHSVKPYGITGANSDSESEDSKLYNGNKRRSRKKDSKNGTRDLVHGMSNMRISGRNVKSGNSDKTLEVDLKKQTYDSERNRRNYVVRKGRTGIDARRSGSGTDRWKAGGSRRREVYDMSLKQDGSYELQSGLQEKMSLRGGLEDDFELD